MFSSVPLASVLLIASSTTVNAYWRQTCSIVQTGRIDPIISPGQVSSHVHKISGGSNINLDSDYDSMRNSTCTSCEILADKSGYWTPQLYYQHGDGTFEEVPNGQTVVYYLGRGDNRANIVPFPPKFKMISGNPYARSYDPNTMTYGNASHPSRPLADRVSFNCLDASPLPETPYMNRTNCKNGLRAQIQFPSCWDGVNDYLPDNSHVDYMSQIDNGVCPPSHPVQFIHLFYEVLYGVNNIDQSDGGRFVFANGDPTGYGYHGDFLMGWDQDVLAASLAQCANTDNGGAISACAPLASIDTSTYGYNCPQYAPTGIPLINETVTGHIGKSLPGCINITNGPGPASAADLACPPGVDVPEVEDFPPQTPTDPLVMTPGQAYGLKGWSYVDCYTDQVNNTRTLSAVTKSTSNMTIASCQSYCANGGYRFAGLEYGNQCFCSSMISSVNSGNQTSCNMYCAGNRTEVCGSPNFISIFNNTQSTATISAPGAGATSAAAGTYLGCATDNVNGRALSGPSTSNSNMTLENCRAYCDNQGYVLSGTEYGQECYCGNSLTNGGALLSSNTTCSNLCAGNSQESCGGSNRLSVFQSLTVTGPVNLTTFHPSGSNYVGCWIDSNTRALNGPSYTDGTNMTLDNCVSYCGKKGYGYAGVEYASQCYCGSSLAAGSLAPDTDCSMQCSGNKQQMCGAGWRLTVFGPGNSAASGSTSSSSSSVSLKSSSTSSSSSSKVSISSSSSSTKSTSTSASSSTKTTAKSTTSTAKSFTSSSSARITASAAAAKPAKAAAVKTSSSAKPTTTHK